MIDPWRVERFRLLFEEQQTAVYRFLHALTGSADTAKELAQETFYRAFKSFGLFEERSAASTWLCGIARNVALNHFRSGRQFVRVFDVDANQERAGGDAPDRLLLTNELREAIRVSLVALDEDKRIAFTLKVLEQKSYEEIATITGSAIAKLKTDVHRARLHLRAALASYREDS
jgi:RNA polymerase sigma-70 factor (ECF subfamily)